MDLRRMVTLVNLMFYKKIILIGLGATGSKIFDLLIRAGFDPALFNLYDHDIVEQHNICNQIFTEDHIGMPKVLAAKQISFDITGKESANIYVQRFTANDFNQIIDDSLVIIAIDDNDTKKAWLNTLVTTLDHCDILCPVIGIDSGEVVYLSLHSNDTTKTTGNNNRYIEGIPSSASVKTHEVLSPCKERQDCNTISTMTAALTAQAVYDLTQGKNVPFRQLFSVQNGLEGVSS